jgi:AraC-like DNA-binding protein
MGTSIHKYIKEARYDRARELLCTTDLSVKEIVTSIGLSDSSNFVRQFKKYFGAPPKKWRAQRR